MNYYSSTISDFLDKSPDEILGVITGNNAFDLSREQRNSFKLEIDLFKRILTKELDGQIIFEYTIPRVGKRIDVVLLLNNIVFSVEFKVGSSTFLSDDNQQAYEYGVELQCFQKESQGHYIVPILVATEAPQEKESITINLDKGDNLFDLIQVNEDNLKYVIEKVIEEYGMPQDQQWASSWVASRYYATPTLVEATSKLFSNHNVKDIANCESQENLSHTTDTIKRIIEETKAKGSKSIVFVTGVPGAGKSLVGLNIASEGLRNSDHAVYLSGNAPLVHVLREQLIRDWRKKINPKTGALYTMQEAKLAVTPLIQIIHNYRDAMLDKVASPIVDNKLEIDPAKAIHDERHGYAEVEHIAIFDEAQRSWKKEDLCKFLDSNNYGSIAKDFPYSEAGFMIWSMNLREDWAVIICLVGGGQEINHGEAGIAEWVTTLKDNFPEWDLYMAREELSGLSYQSEKLEATLSVMNLDKIHDEKTLHLKTDIRSIRSNKVASFVEALLAKDQENAAKLYRMVNKKYPIYLTRSVDKAKRWLFERSERGNNRTGLLVSSRGGRVKSQGYVIKKVNDTPKLWYTDWFLNSADDVRSSNFMEDLGNEFIVQGLELDYVGLIWESDLRASETFWDQWRWKGGRWEQIDKGTAFEDSEEKQRQYNAYRVLLTRARQGMVIIVPEGSHENDVIRDDTRKSEYYDCTYEYLKSLGIKEL